MCQFVVVLQTGSVHGEKPDDLDDRPSQGRPRCFTHKVSFRQKMEPAYLVYLNVARMYCAFIRIHSTALHSYCDQ